MKHLLLLAAVVFLTSCNQEPQTPENQKQAEYKEQEQEKAMTPSGS